MPVFRGKKHWLILLTGVLLSSILLAACDTPASILNTQGPVARNETFLFWVILVISIIIFVLVEGMLIYSIVRFREKPGAPNPRQLHGDMRLEIAWTIAPTVVLLIVLGFTIRGLFQVAPESIPAPAGQRLEVEVVGHQWWWEFYYPAYKITTADTMHIPEGEVVHVTLFSNNVIHSFWVPSLTGKTDVVPGHSNEKWFSADKGTAGKSFPGICTEYCGTQHANMKFDVQVDTADGFQTWVSAQQQVAAAPAAGSLAAQGEALFKQQCTACHGIVGGGINNIQSDADPGVACLNPAAACLKGPNLTHFGSRTYIAGEVLQYNSADCTPGDPNLLQKCGLAQWLHDPQGMKPGNDMQIGQLTNDQISQLVAYLESLK